MDSELEKQNSFAHNSDNKYSISMDYDSLPVTMCLSIV